MKESPQEKAFREILPDGMSDKVNVTQSYHLYLNIVNSHLRTIYGGRADLDARLNAYFRSPEYRKACRNGTRIKDIELLQREDIEQMLREDELYSLKINELLQLYRAFNELSPETYNYSYAHELASILGILPDIEEQALLCWLVQRKGITKHEREQLYSQIKVNNNLLNCIIHILAKLCLPGFQLSFPHVGCVMTQQRGKFYYRGENAFYKSSKAVIYRKSNNLQPIINHVVNRLRFYECWDLLDQFNAVKHWHYSEINYMALAQHYGLYTPMIDITSDLNVALFFACCKLDTTTRKWRPLQRSEIEFKNSRKKVAKFGGDSRYGILYRTPVEITDMKWAITGDNVEQQLITPVGYQPFMRCSHQYSYMMLTHDDKYDLRRDPLFSKYKIKLDEELCNWIYAKMDCGNKVFPYYDPDISQAIEEINDKTSFSESVFQTAMSKMNEVLHLDTDTVRQMLSKNGFTIKDNARPISIEGIKKINSQYSVSDAIEKTNISPISSPLLILPQDMLLDKDSNLLM